MRGPLPKPPDQRRRRNASTFNGVTLPPTGRSEAAPDLPDWRAWHPETRKLWAQVWATPQATQFEPHGLSMFGWAVLYDLRTECDRPM
jgi:hypothetical protein